MSPLKNFCQACENNKKPILQKLRVELANHTTVLEIGSGSGQHALFFGEHLPHLCWQTTELPPLIADLNDNLQSRPLLNVPQPIALDVCQHPWPVAPASAIFTANTLHIMPWSQVEHFFTGVGQTLQRQGRLCIYGPFRYRNNYTSDSNARFDRWLRGRDPRSGIRDFEAVNRLARSQDLELIVDHRMPAHNQLLVWESV